jgi:hypothetical protein
MSTKHPPATFADIELLERDAQGDLVLQLRDGTRHGSIRPVRGFPISQPDYGISLVDGEAREVVWIENLSTCDSAICTLIRDELAMRDFLPVIQRIYSISGTHEPSEWDVQTDRGRVQFILNVMEDVRRLDAQRAMVTDGNNVQYLVMNLGMMDAKTRRYLERYLA